MHLLFSYIGEGVFYLLLFFTTIHIVLLSYHWFSYGEKRKDALLALAVYLLGAAILFNILALNLGSL